VEGGKLALFALVPLAFQVDDLTIGCRECHFRRGLALEMLVVDRNVLAPPPRRDADFLDERVLEHRVEREEAVIFAEDDVVDVIRFQLRRRFVLRAQWTEGSDIVTASEDLDQIGQNGFDGVGNIGRNHLGTRRQSRDIRHIALVVVERAFALSQQFGVVIEADRTLALRGNEREQFVVAAFVGGRCLRHAYFL